MPLQPVTGTLHMPVETEADVRKLVEEGLQLVNHPSRLRRQNASRDLEDHFFYLGAVKPHLVRPLQHAFAGLSDEQRAIFAFRFKTWLYLLDGADDACVEILASALSTKPGDNVLQAMLGAAGTPTALSAVGDAARDHALASEFEKMGFHIPASHGPARPRFTLWRRAIRVQPFPRSQTELEGMPNPIGLPLSRVVTTASQQLIRWHYLSVDLPDGGDIPPLPSRRLHLVSAPIFIGWALFCTILPDGRYEVHSVVRDDDDDELDTLLEEYVNDEPVGLGTAELVLYDDSLIFLNAHVLQTEGVVGDLGGPPIGLYPNPKCPLCHTLMFHILTVESGIREYGDGMRSLFVCEACAVAACTATNWN